MLNSQSDYDCVAYKHNWEFQIKETLLDHSNFIFLVLIFSKFLVIIVVYDHPRVGVAVPHLYKGPGVCSLVSSKLEFKTLRMLRILITNMSVGNIVDDMVFRFILH